MTSDERLRLSVMRDADSFDDADTLDRFLAQQLDEGSLALVLGAGISGPLGLPDWEGLISSLSARLSIPLRSELSEDEQAEAIQRGAKLDDISFAEVVREVLYTRLDRSFSGLLANQLLSSLGALAMPSRRGSASSIVTFNFDDLLETYLGYYGFDVEAVSSVPAWNGRADVRVFHPHGLLPSDAAQHLRAGIVLTRSHYDRIVGDVTNLWHATVYQVMSSHTCVFLGLSGADANLTSLLTRVQQVHRATAQGHPYWGIRVSNDANDPRRTAWESRGVYQKTVGTYADVPRWLRAICQLAARAYRVT